MSKSDPNTTDIHAFRAFLIEDAFNVNEEAKANPDLDRVALGNAIHFMQEVELVQAATVDLAQKEPDGYFSSDELIVLGVANAKAGELINYIWQQIRSGNEVVIQELSELELNHIKEHGVSSYTPTHVLGLAEARFEPLEAFASLSVPSAIPEED